VPTFFRAFGLLCAFIGYKNSNMKIAYIATYTPRQCGIGTFTGNQFTAMNCKTRSNNENEGIVIAMTEGDRVYDYPEEVKFEIHQDKPADYLEAAKFINNSGADICILEHEFGIFGGRDGSYILSLLHRLNIPVIAVLHTVLKNPSNNQRDITREIAAVATKTVVMTRKAVEFLTQVYGIKEDKISIIDHGIPDFEFSHIMSKKEIGYEGKNVLLTFGLISRNKGIETVIKALPAVIEKHPDTVYIILGKTHPSVARHSGEEYRDYLKSLAAELNISDNVIFVDEFANEKKLFKYLSAADVYVTPYLNEAQITSGTLSYAVGAGCAVISTPYWHAAELLTPERGRLFDFNDAEKLTGILMELFDNPALMQSLRRNARAYGREVVWPKAGERYLRLAEEILSDRTWQITKREKNMDPQSIPPFALDHIKRMTDSTGLIQHAKFGIPNLKEGYCLDDNARALLMVMMSYKQKKHLQAVELLPIYLSYIHYMQNEDGTFRNFLSFNRNFLDEIGSEDSFGRTIWALGYLLSTSPNDQHYEYGKEIFLRAAPNFDKLHYVRGIANTMIGIGYYLQGNTTDREMKDQLRRLADKLVAEYKAHSTTEWKWYEPMLTYDNAVLPLAMLHAGEILEEHSMMNIAMESLDFLSGITLKNGYLSVIGNEKWFTKDCAQSMFAQQPIDVMMMALMFQKAFMLTKDETYADRLNTSFMWFLGENDLQLQVYDPETKGCRDGLEHYGVNKNQGAESTLAYLISHLAVTETAAISREQSQENSMIKNRFSDSDATSIAV
jgi:glycosyltransferase involved in cell wall biosynthesis